MNNHRTLVQDLRTRPSLYAPDEAFVTKVMDACMTAEKAAVRRDRGRSRALGIFVVAAAALLAVGQLHRASGDRIAARGFSSVGTSHDLLVTPWVVKDHTLFPVEGAQLSGGDALAVRLENPSEQTKYLLVFAVDSANAIHWIYPAYVDGSSDPTSIEIKPGEEPHLLDEVVEPDHPAEGTLRVIAVTSSEPLSVKETERRFTAQENVSKLFPNAVVKEWRAAWHAR